SLPVFTAFAVWLGVGGAFTRPREFWLQTMSQIEYALYADTRSEMQQAGGSGFGSSALMGVVFAAGWTPCIGPIYGAILTLAANGGSVSDAGVMLTAYSLGLGIPFMITALMLDGAQGFLRGLSRQMGTIKLVSGGFLIVIGVLIASGQLQRLSAIGSQGELGVISYRMEECFTEAVAGEIAWGAVIGCVNADEPSTTGEPSIGSATVTDDALVDTVAQPQTITGAAANNATIGLSVGQIAPDFTTTTPDGDAISLSDYRGDIVLLNFWATWCGPCRIEMPEFQEAYDTHREDGFTILAVNNQESPEQVIPFVEQLELTFPIAMDQRGDINLDYAIVNYPSTFDDRAVCTDQKRAG
ncbi:MAG: cytochrome c biogenesis protein/redoxin, partial [Chloroflexota bacterium]